MAQDSIPVKVMNRQPKILQQTSGFQDGRLTIDPRRDLPVSVKCAEPKPNEPKADE